MYTQNAPRQRRRRISMQPSKHETLNQCWADVGSASQTSAQHQPSIGSTPANTRHLPMLFQCWASVEDGGPTLKRHWGMPRVCWDVSCSLRIMPCKAKRQYLLTCTRQEFISADANVVSSAQISVGNFKSRNYSTLMNLGQFIEKALSMPRELTKRQP